MRNYISLEYVHANVSTNSNLWYLGRHPDEIDSELARSQAAYHWTINQITRGKVYFDLNRTNFWALMWFGANWLPRIGTVNQISRVWNDGNPLEGDSFDALDFIKFESPRKTWSHGH